jgi:two-component system sensor histidine kinase SenX3
MRGRTSARQPEPLSASEPGRSVISPLEELALRQEAALDLVAEGVVICGPDGEIVYRNSVAERLTGGPSDALVAQAVSETTRQALAGEKPELQLDLVSPARRSILIRAFPIASGQGSGRVEGAVVVVEDVTERIRLESVRRDFVANVSHELKTPAGALTLLAETIEGEDDPEVVARLARRMGGEADRLVRIIDDLLDLSRIEANEAPSRGLVAVGAVVDKAVEPLRDLAAAMDVTLSVGEVPTDVAVPGDERDLVSALSNLVDNAIKYSEPKGEVHIAARSLDGRVEVTVSDAGVGIPSRDLERVFERFYRVDRARSRSTGGTGLGLAIVRHVAANHGGSVRVHSKEGEGSTFVLDLPAVAGGDPAEETGAREDNLG